MRGGENKSDPRDAATIAELARTRPGLRLVDTEHEIDVDIRLLVGRRGEMRVTHAAWGGCATCCSCCFPRFNAGSTSRPRPG